MKDIERDNQYDKLEHLYFFVHMLVLIFIVVSTIFLIIKYVPYTILKVLLSIINVIIQAYLYEKTGYFVETFLDKILKSNKNQMNNNGYLQSMVESKINQFLKELNENDSINIPQYNKDLFKSLLEDNVSKDEAILIMREIQKKQLEIGLLRNSNKNL